jgi:hypothetical protein
LDSEKKYRTEITITGEVGYSLVNVKPSKSSSEKTK